MISKFIEYISSFIRLEKEEIELIASLIQIKSVKKGDVLLVEGMISKTAYFVLKGCVRMYYLVEGEEKTTFFYTENQFITSFKSFTQKEPSTHYLESIEASVLISISQDVENELLQKLPKLYPFIKAVLEEELGNYQEMLSKYIISNPEQRYLNLQKNYPNLINRIPQYQLASYLGIKPESLSRIRNRLVKKRS